MDDTPQPLFVLTCMRSFSSVVTSMLGQHSQLFVMPEINPFISDTLQDNVMLLGEFRPRSLDGIYRLVAELEFGKQNFDTVNEAKDWVASHGDWSPVDLMDWVAQKVYPRRVIEKSPSTVVTRGGIERALRFFPDANFLHLYRHPIDTCASIAKITKYGKQGGVQKKFVKDPELSWLESNSRIIREGAQIPAGQFMSIQGEDVLNDPEGFIQQLGDWLDIETTPEDLTAIYHPERSPFACFGPRNAPFGNDPNFLKNPHFSKRDIKLPSLLSDLSWAPEGRQLRPETLLLSHQLGYFDRVS